MDKRIPLSIITGFSGAGKTTFIQNLVEQRKDKTFALIDHKRNWASATRQVLDNEELSISETREGCLYCHQKNQDDLFAAMYHLVDHEYDFDHLLVETADTEDPSALVYGFMTDCCVHRKFRLDSVMCLVDLNRIQEQFEAHQIVGKQIALADNLVFNPAGEPMNHTYEQTHTWLRQVNPVAYFARVTEDCIRDPYTLARAAFQSERIALDTERVDAFHQYHHPHLSSYSLHLDGYIDLEGLVAWLNELLMFGNQEIYRIKGVLNVRDKAQKVILQSLRENFVCIDGGEWSANEERKNKFYFTGKELDIQALNAELRSFREATVRVL